MRKGMGDVRITACGLDRYEVWIDPEVQLMALFEERLGAMPPEQARKAIEGILAAPVRSPREET